MHKLLISTIFAATTVTTFPSEAKPNNSDVAQKCKLIGSSYQLVDDPNFELVFSQPNEEQPVPLSFYDKGISFWMAI